MLKIFITFLFFINTFCLFGSENENLTDKHNVLLINSYSSTYIWSDNLIKGVQEELNFSDFYLFTEHMDGKLFFHDSLFVKFANYISRKYYGQKIDLIIAADDIALDFMLQYRDSVFGEIPVVFCGINNFGKLELSENGLYTGVLEHIEIKENIEIITELYPKLKNIYAISDQTTTGKYLTKNLLFLENRYSEKIKINILDSLSFKQVIDTIQCLNYEEDVILYLSLQSDINNKHFDVRESISQINKYSKVPIFALHDLGIGYGIMGGKLVCANSQGKLAGGMAYKIIKEKKAIHEIHVTQSINHCIFDYKQLEKYDKTNHNFSMPVVLVNEPNTFIERQLVWVVFVLVVLFIIVIVLILNIKKRKIADKKLNNSFDFLNAIINAINEPIFVKDSKHEWKFVNNKFCEIVGLKKEELLGKTDIDSFKEEKARFFMLQDDYVFQTGKAINYEDAFISPNKESYIMETKKSLYKAPNGEKYIVGILTDVTENRKYRNHLEELFIERTSELRESREKYRELFHNSNDGIIIYDKKDEVLSINKKAKELFAMRDKKLKKFDVKEIYEKAIEKDNLKDQTNYEVELRRKDNTTFWAEISASSYEVAGELVNQIIIRDISLRKHQDRKLKEQHKFTRLLMNTIPIPLFYIDKSGHYETCNYSFEDAFGIQEANLKDYTLFDFTKNRELTNKYEKINKELIKNPGTKKYEGQIEFADGTIHDMVFFISTVCNINGQGRGILGIMHDITERKKAETALIKSEKQLREANTTKDKVFSIIAHDLRNPIGSIRSMLDLVVNHKEYLEEEKTNSLLDLLYDTAEETYNLLENLLYWARSQKDKMKYSLVEFSINQMVNENISLLKSAAKEKKIKLFSIAEKIVDVFGDRETIRTVVRNLISNAIKFTSENGEISVLIVQENNGFAKISVIDNGIGISEENLKKMFKQNEHFTTYGTNQEKGTGLGLLLCKEFVEKNGGKISVESQEKRGSTFTFTIPLAQKNRKE